MRVSLRGKSVMQQGHAETPRKGSTLLEAIVAMILLAIAVSSIAALTSSVSRSSVKVTGAAYANGILMHEVNRLIALPFDSLANGHSSFSTSSGPYQHTRTVTIEPQAANVKAIRVVITPSNSAFRPDTVKFTRTNARTTKVLCTKCL